MYVLFCLAVAGFAARAACVPAPVKSTGQWVLTFEDDFAGDALNTSSWTVSNYSSVISEYDGHDALFIADRVSVFGGSLHIDTVYAPGTVFNGVAYNMTSGWIDSQHKVNQTKGRFEASIKMPNPNATGSWPAWWLLPEGECWPVSGEIDIVCAGSVIVFELPCAFYLIVARRSSGMPCQATTSIRAPRTPSWRPQPTTLATAAVMTRTRM